MTERSARDLVPSFPRGDDLGLIILDCDGVLFESSDANAAYYNAVLAAAGLPPLDAEGVRLCHMLSGSQLFERLFGDSPEQFRRVRELANAVDYGPFYGLMTPVAKLTETLTRLAAHCPLALASNRGRTLAGVLTRFQLERFFTVSVGVLDVARPKPAPDLLHACIARTGVAPERAVYVGDMPLDRDAAAAAGIAFVGIGPESYPWTAIRNLAELPDMLLR